MALNNAKKTFGISKYLSEIKNQISIYGFKRQKYDVIVNFYIFSIVLCLSIIIVNGQIYPTRDPRFYSREGDLSYKWPNPGDPDYR